MDEKNFRFGVWREFCAVVFNKTPAGGLSKTGVISTGVRLFGELHHRLLPILHSKTIIKRISNNFYVRYHRQRI